MHDDDGFHEIQLNGKQLVFLFMAATVVSVVIFLCGVLVGRGVKTERAVSSADAATVAAVENPTLPQATVTTPPVGADPTTAAPPPAAPDFIYPSLDKKTAPPEKLKPTAAPALPTPTSHENSLPVATPSDAPSAVKPQSVSTPAGDGYVVQIAAVPEHAADTIAKRLTSKGYGSVFVVAPGARAPTLYRVRVRFKTLREAEAVKSRLQKEEQFAPWIIR